ncbi:hypothetical protein ACFVUS_06210 [Nocardia sp. NPDC058058]|uniref:hypothetical protein n=1 Tax=Nocardia sp. NPDC058058 TaxID=3346317 RepID=UPI0036DF436A
MIEAGSEADSPGCQPESLRARAARLISDRGWAWPPASPLSDRDLAQECALLGVPLRVGELANRSQFGLPEALELLVSAFLDEIEHERPELARTLRDCVVVETGRSGRAHGTSTPYRGEGVVVFLDGAMLLMFADMLRHAMTLIGEAPGRVFVDAPGPGTVRAAARLLWAFRQPARGFERSDLPAAGHGRYNGAPAFGKLLWFGERFLIGHELAHALFRLGRLTATPGIRAMIDRIWPDLPAQVREDWAEELSADRFARTIVCGGVPELVRPVAAAACAVATAYLGVLERSTAIPSTVPLPIALEAIREHAHCFRTHPPAELRLELLVKSSGPDTPMMELYLAAMHTLRDALHQASNGNCIAPIDFDAWCANPRGPAGWLCDPHGDRDRY